jgi:hypothetical protein
MYGPGFRISTGVFYSQKTVQSLDFLE